MPKRRICVVGGGPGGLFISQLLTDRKAGEVTLYQSGSRLGGKIYTQRDGDYLYEEGCAELYDWDGDPLRGFIEDELGLPTRNLCGRSTFVEGAVLSSRDDLEWHFGPDSFANLLGFLDEVRRLRPKEDFCRAPSQKDNDHELAGRSFREVLDKIDDPRVRHFIKISANCDLAVDPRLTTALYGIDNMLVDAPLFEGEYCQIYTVESGLERIIEALVPRIGAEIRLNDPVRMIERRGEQFAVVGERSAELFDHVVLALPVDRLARIRFGGSLAEPVRRHCERYAVLGHYLRATLFYETPFWRDRVDGNFFQTEDFGGATVYDEGTRYDNGDRGVASFLIGGTEALQLSAAKDSQIVELAHASIAKLAPPSRSLGSRVSRWINAVNGQPGGLPVLDERRRHFPDADEDPGLLFVGDYLFDTTVSGSLCSARIVADILGA